MAVRATRSSTGAAEEGETGDADREPGASRRESAAHDSTVGADSGGVHCRDGGHAAPVPHKASVLELRGRGICPPNEREIQNEGRKSRTAPKAGGQAGTKPHLNPPPEGSFHGGGTRWLPL